MFNVVKPMKIHGSSMNIHELVPYIGANYNDRTSSPEPWNHGLF